MPFILETRGEVDISELGGAALKGFADVYRELGGKFRMVRLEPPPSANTDGVDSHQLCNFESGFDEKGIPHDIGSIYAYEVRGCVECFKNADLESLLRKSGVSPDWVIRLTGGALPDGKEYDVGVKIARVTNVVKVWHYWVSEGKVGLKRVLG